MMSRGNNYIGIFYALKFFSEQLNAVKLDGYGINPTKKFLYTTTNITLKKHHIWVYPGYVFRQ